MNAMPEYHRLVRHVAVLEERMSTMQANLTATLEGFRKDQERWRADHERWRAEQASRDTRFLLWVVGAIGVAATVISVTISQQNSQASIANSNLPTAAGPATPTDK